MSPKIGRKSIKNRFQVELALKCVPRRSQDVSRWPQDVPKTPQGTQDGPKMRPRRPQDAPRRPPRSGKFGAQKRIFSGPPPNLDFGASWSRFWEVLASILGSVLGGFKELKSHKTFKKLGGFGINFEKCYHTKHTKQIKHTEHTKHTNYKTHKTHRAHKTHKTHKTHKIPKTHKTHKTQIVRQFRTKPQRASKSNLFLR